MTSVLGIDSRVFFSVVLLLVILERLFELTISRRNTRRALARGALEFGAVHYRFMVASHTAFLLSCIVEVWWLHPRFIPALGWPMIALCAGVMALRYWVVGTLGERWTTRVIVMPDLAPVTGGPYRFARHPNYLAVIIEIAALPLIHSAWITALVFSAINALILRIRIRVEEEALSRCSGYETLLAERGRFLPRRTGTRPR
jgi:methyltransferase